MRILDSDLRGLSVVTETGDPVGKISGFMFDIDTHSIIHYVVSKSRLLPALLPDELIVHHSQVISVDEEKMVVKGGLSEVEERTKALQVRKATGGVAQMTRQK
jgi:sporulation protein YlmC with PRC-barrel domain